MVDDFYYLREAYVYASLYSTDPSTQNGALLVDCSTGCILTSAVNRFPDGVQSSKERWDRPLKYSYVEHAERNCIYRAARSGIKTLGLKMYCPWVACTDCARAIIQAGIVEVIGHDFDLHKTSSHWLDSIKIADQMLEEAGVRIRRVPGKIGGVAFLFNGIRVEP